MALLNGIAWASIISRVNVRYPPIYSKSVPWSFDGISDNASGFHSPSSYPPQEHFTREQRGRFPRFYSFNWSIDSLRSSMRQRSVLYALWYNIYKLTRLQSNRKCKTSTKNWTDFLRRTYRLDASIARHCVKQLIDSLFSRSSHEQTTGGAKAYQKMELKSSIQE